MERTQYADASYRQPNVPPATPPVIDSNADARAAAELGGDVEFFPTVRAGDGAGHTAARGASGSGG